MPFSNKIKSEALARSGRHCCLCHKSVGINVEVHHIVQEADGGKNTLDNAMVLCFDCHADTGHYNVRHPRGNKYTPDELRRRRDAWYVWYASNPGKPWPNEAIRVSQSLLHFWSGSNRHTNTLQIHNVSNDLFYTVVVLFTAIPSNFLLQDVRIEPIGSNKEPIPYDLDGIELVFGELIYDCGLGKTLLIPQLEPDERRRYKITHTIPDYIGMKVQPKAKVEIYSASFEPMQIFKTVSSSHPYL